MKPRDRTPRGRLAVALGLPLLLLVARPPECAGAQGPSPSATTARPETDRPDLLGQPISHGCIRMSNDDVLRLYEELEVGTPVIIH